MLHPKRVSEGQYIDLANLTQDDINIEDINRSLNCLYRFTGHWKDKKPLTVAQHTMLVMRLAEMYFPEEKDVLLDCLLHDWPEAYYGDIATPLKKLFGYMYRDYTTEIDEKVYKKFWKLKEPFTPEVESKRKLCDLMSLDIERRNMWKSQLGKDKWPETPFVLPMKEKEKLFDWAQSFNPDLVNEYRKI